MKTLEEKKAYARAYYQANKEKARATNAAYHQDHKEKRRAYYQANNEKRRATKKAWRQANREKSYATGKAWALTHRGACCTAAARRRAAKLQRTCTWADLEAIKLIYATALPGEHVDHIVPLQGELVSGLHVDYNLQHLQGSDNCSKSNTFDPWTYVHTLPGE